MRLIECVFQVPVLGCPIIYGVSNNDASWWSNDAVAYLGWQTQDNAERYREALDATGSRPGSSDPDAVYQGGKHAVNGIVGVI